MSTDKVYSGECVQVVRQDRVATVMIDNPPLNVLNRKVVEELVEAFTLLEHDPAVGAIILTAAGSKAFMAGADIKEFPGWIDNPDMRSIVQQNHDCLTKIERSSKPTIALLGGMALGGGCELALACDIRLAEEHVRIGLPEIKLGIFPGGGGTQRLVRLVGVAKAKELMYTGDPISAAEANQIGLVNKVVPSGDGVEEAQAMAQKFASHSLNALSCVKLAVDSSNQHWVDSGIDYELDLFCRIFETEDAKEGIRAFIEKRPPVFSHQ